MIEKPATQLQLPRGFLACGTACGIKPNGQKDLALVASESRAHCAGVFTLNRVQAAPVLVSKAHLQSNPRNIQAVVINSGCANAVTGPTGFATAMNMAQTVGKVLACPPAGVMVMSTGVIGVPLDRGKVTQGIVSAARELSPTGLEDAAQAILTTDTRTKTAYAVGNGYRVTGIAKGSGMIHPKMATMLAVVITDADVDAAQLQKQLNAVVKRSFNRISVDGDMSTNDMVLVLANGASGISPPSADFERHLERVCHNLAQQIVADGEGATKFIEIHLTGAQDEAAAETAAKGVARSLLFKTAMFGADPNWGRVLSALGQSGAMFDPNAVSISFADKCVLKDGLATNAAPRDLASILERDRIKLHIVLGHGPGEAVVWTTDLSHQYVKINATYTS